MMQIKVIKNTAGLSLFLGLFLAIQPVQGEIRESVMSARSDHVELSQEDRAESEQTIRKALENEIVRERLQSHGLSVDEVEEKLSEMNDEQIQMLAQASDDLLAGGALGLIIAVLIIVLLVLLILRIA